MDSILNKLLSPKVFDTFVNDNMKLSTYKAEWKDELGAPEYCAAKAFQAYLAEYGAAVVGSIIEKNAEKPTHVMPTAQEIIGALSRIADEWQMDNDRLEQFYYLEGRYNEKKAGYKAEVRDAEFQKLVTYLFKPFEKAVIAPHKRIDMLYFEGLFNGTQTVSAANNSKSGVAFQYPVGTTIHKTQTAVWSDTANARPIDDIQYVVDQFAARGKTVKKIRMSKRTFRALVATAQVKSNFTIMLAKSRIENGIVSLAAVNEYLESILLPTIEVDKDRFAELADGSNTNLTPDNRVVFQCADRVAVLKVSDPLESIDRLPNKSYSTFDDNLVGYWRNEKGRFIDYDMWATPVFTGKNDFAILKTDEH